MLHYEYIISSDRRTIKDKNIDKKKINYLFKNAFILQVNYLVI